MTLLRELITIPEAIQRGDFVISLAAGVADPARTLESYVVTPQLADAFGDALRFIASAVSEKQEQGRLPRRQLRLGQLAFHGRAPHAPAA